MEKVLVTGAAGFIGSHTVKRLIDNGYYVIGLDNLNDHYSPVIKKKRIEWLKSEFGQKFKFIKMDINNKSKMIKLLKNIKFKVIINLAAKAGVRKSLIVPDEYIKSNYIGVLTILELIRKYQKDTLLIQASTSSIYGGTKPPFNEIDKVDEPFTPYAASKKAAEELCYSYHYLFKINVLIFRFFTVYGPFGRPDMCMFRFIKWIDTNESIRLFGDGSQERGFSFVDDITNALYKGLDFKGYEIVNLGNNKPTSINSVINLIEKGLSKKAIITKFPMHPADILSTSANINKAGKLFNWKPEIDIDTGVHRTIEWYEKNREWVKKIPLSE